MDSRFPDGTPGGRAPNFPIAGARPTFKQMAAAAKETDSEALIEAIAAETVDAGFANLSIERITARAGLSRLSFEANFEDLRQAVLIAHGVLLDRFINRLLRACEAQPSWPLKVKVGIGLTLDLAAASPARARFLMLDSLTSDPELIRQGVEARDRLASLLSAGRSLAPREGILPDLTEQALVAGLAGVIAARLMSGEAKHLPALAPQLVELTLLPYLGAEAAAAVARRPRPPIDEL